MSAPFRVISSWFVVRGEKQDTKTTNYLSALLRTALQAGQLPTTNRFGFTLVELMVAISIVAILSTVGMLMFSSAQESARDATRRGDIDNLANAISIYYAANKSLPLAGTVCSNSSGGTDWPANFKTAIAPYINKINVDPRNSATRVYCYTSSMWCASGTSCSGYKRPNLWTYLERCNKNETETGDGWAQFGYGCTNGNHYMRVIEQP